MSALVTSTTWKSISCHTLIQPFGHAKKNVDTIFIFLLLIFHSSSFFFPFSQTFSFHRSRNSLGWAMHFFTGDICHACTRARAGKKDDICWRILSIFFSLHDLALRIYQESKERRQFEVTCVWTHHQIFSFCLSRSLVFTFSLGISSVLRLTK